MLYPVNSRSTEDLIPPILELIPHNSLVYTDELKTYHKLDEDYRHFTVNHSHKEYKKQVDLEDGTHLNVHINTMEGLWNSVRGRFKYRSRRQFDRIVLLLCEIMYRHSGGDLYSPFKVRK